MTTIFTATATNNGFYLALAVAAADEAAARAAFLSADIMGAPADEGGDYTLGHVTPRIADEDGHYPNDRGSMSENIDGDDADEVLASPGTVIMLDSGANG